MIRHIIPAYHNIFSASNFSFTKIIYNLPICCHSYIPNLYYTTSSSKINIESCLGNNSFAEPCFVLGQGQIPECAATSPSTQDKTADFHRSISVDGITDKKRLLLTLYRNQGNKLLKLGIDPSDLEATKTEIAAFWDDYTETPFFLFGPLFHSRMHEAPEVIQRKDRDLEPEQNKPTPVRK